jgi:hypothetical protein
MIPWPGGGGPDCAHARHAELAAFELKLGRDLYQFDFAAMVVDVAYEPSFPSSLDWERYDLRRGEGGAWHRRLPDERFRGLVAHYKPMVADPSHARHADAEMLLASLGERPEWIAIPEAVAAKVETRYELFLRNFKV